MTWKRVVNRNGLADGDYFTTPSRHVKGVITDSTQATMADIEETKRFRYDSLTQRVEEYEKAFKALAGDIRRFENDSVDENGVCKYISRKTGIDENTVAAVILEFMS